MSTNPGGRDKPLVLIIHGTWNPPDCSEGSEPTWYQLGDHVEDSFVRQLNDGLTAHGLGRPVRATLPGQTCSFAWSGSNKHEDRVEAAAKLADELDRLMDEGYAPIRLIAHSHGGNVVLGALQTIRSRAAKRGEQEARKVWKRALVAAASGEQVDVAVDEALSASEMVDMDAEGAEAVRTMLIDTMEAVPDIGRLGKYAGTALSSFVRPKLSVREEFRRKFTDAFGLVRVDRVVFLGTPFYEKRWTLDQSPLAKAADILQRLLTTLIIGIPVAVYMAYVILFFYGFLLSLTPWATLPAWSPVDWGPWSWAGASIGALIGLGSIAIMVWEDAGRSDGNLYDTEGRERDWPGPPIDALVVHADLMDEALLALSVEPLAYTFLVPALAELVRPVLWHKLPPPRSRETEGLANLGRRALQSFGVRSKSVALAILWPFRLLFAWGSKRYLTNSVLTVALTSGYGLPKGEFTTARVEATGLPRVALPDYRMWALDVSEELLRHEAPSAQRTRAASQDSTPSHGGASPAADRYAFLFDDEKLEALAAKSFIWEQVEAQLPAVFSRMGRVRTPPEERRLKRLCVMADTRVQEFGGAVQLAHSTYYSNKPVIANVADFLAGADGPWELLAERAES